MTDKEFAEKIKTSNTIEADELDGELTYSFPKSEGLKRLKELILHIANKCEDHDRFGSTKLNKILFYSDFAAYKRLGTPITGETYLALEHGPAPERLVDAREELLGSEDAVMRKLNVIDHVEKRLMPTRPAELDNFSATEIEIVNQVISALKDKTAREASELSHRLAGWRAAAEGERIPYEAALIYTRTFSEGDRREFERLAEERGW